MKNWIPRNGKPYIISGPCSAESEEQMLNIAGQLKDTADVFRAGVWKPRTRPNAFEGHGELALAWLDTVKKETGIKTATEVANAQHVDAALKAGVDVLWIGARTSVNPFSVQEIADALKGVRIPVMVKNPINPDLQLWIGALERIAAAGIEEIAAIHRGFSWFEKTPFRNDPKWEYPIELKRLFPDLEIICDPSHIAGSRELLQMIAQKALDLNFSGLMIESHHDPDNALSDAKQQITPAVLIDMLGKLQMRQATSKDAFFLNRLEQLRESIDQIDEELIQKLSARMALVDEIGEYKLENHVTIYQVERWREILRTRLEWAEALGLDESFVRELLHALHKASIARQTEVMNRTGAKERRK